MAFIDTIQMRDVDDDVRAMYERQQRHYGYVPGYAKVFSHRPHVMALWAQLQSGIKRHMTKRRFELVTFAAAHELKSSLCSLAHGRALTEILPRDDVIALTRGETPASISAAEAAMIEFARQVARDASAVTAGDVARLKRHGFTDGEVFDIAATAAARAFWTKVIESLGADADAPLGGKDHELAQALAVGRPVELVEPEQLPPQPDVRTQLLDDVRAHALG